VLCLGYCTIGKSQTALPAGNFFYATAFPFWDNLYIKNGTAQGIFYTIYGNTPNRTLVFEYYLSRADSEEEYYQFQVLFFEAKSGLVQFIYLNTPDGGRSAIVGVHASSSGPFMQYSFREPFYVLPNMSITFDTNQNTYTAVLLCGSTTCTMDQACIEDMCVQRGRLNFVARWSRRNSRGYIIVRTPLNNTIYFGNPHANSSADEGRHEVVGDSSQVDNIYWPSNRIPPKGLYNICFSTGSSLLNGTNKSPMTVTVEIRHFQHPMKTMIHSFTKSTTQLNECLNTSDTFIGSVDI
ncbi:unnamed protein product, partial [Rotaria sp. Silwood1]